MPRALAIVLALLFGVAATPLPAPTSRVVDDAGAMPPTTRAAVAAELRALEQRSGVQVAVATVPTLGGEAIEAYATRLFDAWRLGRRERNDGALVLVVPAERRVRIEVGSGLVDRLPDGAAARIIADDMLPRFRVGDIGGGIAAGVDRIVALVAPAPVPPPARPDAAEPRSSNDTVALLVVALVIVSFGLVMALLYIATRRPASATSAAGSPADPNWYQSTTDIDRSRDCSRGASTSDAPSADAFAGGGGASDGSGASGSW